MKCGKSLLMAAGGNTSKRYAESATIGFSLEPIAKPPVLQFNEVAKLHPRVTESSATTCYFSIYVSQVGGGGTAGADVMMSFAITSLETIDSISKPFAPQLLHPWVAPQLPVRAGVQG